jgi:hypothetical protein
MAFQPKIFLLLNQPLLAKVAITALLLPLVSLSLFILDCYNWHRKPADLSVLNLEGWEFEKAKSKYISNISHYLKLGREKVSHFLRCKSLTISSTTSFDKLNAEQQAQKPTSFKFRDQLLRLVRRVTQSSISLGH